MVRTLYIYSHGSNDGDRFSFPLVVPSPDVPSSDLVSCVRDRLGLKSGRPLYFAYESPLGDLPNDAAVPLSAALPDGCTLRVVLPAEVSSHASVLEQDVVHPDAHASRGRLSCCLEDSDLPKPAEIATDLANERTLLAWLRTALAVIRTVFSYATLDGMTRGFLVADVVITMVLSCSALGALLVGWQRFKVVRTSGALQSRRISVRPIYAVFVAVAGISCVAVFIRSPRRFLTPDLSDLLAIHGSLVSEALA
mmetsp:Transcript_90751/g.256253  ORF Transcript_90751/g.256253 Transcript_90751/m.256253 type:complete len:252 (-) Transcript_90751:28-783(-)